MIRFLLTLPLLAGCVPDVQREVDGCETICYFCAGYYNTCGYKEFDHFQGGDVIEILKGVVNSGNDSGP